MLLSNGGVQPSGQTGMAAMSHRPGHAEESAIDGVRALSRFLLVKASPIGPELNNIGVTSNAPVEFNKNNLGAET